MPEHGLRDSMGQVAQARSMDEATVFGGGSRCMEALALTDRELNLAHFTDYYRHRLYKLL